MPQTTDPLRTNGETDKKNTYTSYRKQWQRPGAYNTGNTRNHTLINAPSVTRQMQLAKPEFPKTDGDLTNRR